MLRTRILQTTRSNSIRKIKMYRHRQHQIKIKKYVQTNCRRINNNNQLTEICQLKLPQLPLILSLNSKLSQEREKRIKKNQSKIRLQQIKRTIKSHLLQKRPRYLSRKGTVPTLKMRTRIRIIKLINSCKSKKNRKT